MASRKRQREEEQELSHYKLHHFSIYLALV